MKYKKILIFICLFIFLFSIVSVCASDVTKNSFEKDNQSNDLLELANQDENDIVDLEESLDETSLENVNDNVIDEDQKDLLKSDPKTFSSLNDTINGNNDSDVYLDSDYKFENASDSNFINGIIINRSVTIHGNGFTIDGNNTSRMFLISTSNIIFKNITFTNGMASKSGGVIYGTSTVINCTFIGNHANYGGAIAGSDAINCTFINNSAVLYGGAIVGGNAENCIFYNNSANWKGGAISQGSAINCTFNFNMAQEGGALSGSYVYNSTFINNSALLHGGALHDGAAYNSTLINNSALQDGGAMFKGSVFDCKFIGNVANRDGGAVAFCNVVNCDFINNTADRYGGAMSGEGYNVYDSTFINNTARSGGAVYQANVINCNFTNNMASFYGGAVYNSVVVDSIFEYNKAKKGGAMSGTHASNCTFNYNGAAMYGGAVYDAKVSADSKFNNNFAETGNDTYEVTFFEVNDSKSFRDLDELINGNSDSDIYLDCNYKYDFNIDGDTYRDGIIINRAVTIHGNGFTIDGFDVARIFYVKSYYNSIFEEIIFINGYAGENNGGAINGQTTAINCTFIFNSAKRGGATYNVDVINCTFINNSADYGGAVDYGDLIINCTFENNSANYDASAVYGISRYGNYTQIENCTIINIPYQNNIAFSGRFNSVNCTFIDVEETLIKEYKITVSDFNSTYGSGEKLLFNFTNWDDEEIIDAIIRIEVYDEYGVRKKTDSALSCDDWIVSLDAGKYTAILKALGYRANDVNVSLTINKAPSNVSIIFGEITYGENVTAYVTASADGEVIIWFNGSKRVNVKANTPAAVNLGVLSPGIHTVTAKFVEKNHIESRDEKDLDYRMKIDESNINITIPEFDVKQENNITVTLPDDVTGRVTLNIADKMLSSYINNGVVRFTVPALNLGEYPYTISYSGDYEYLPFDCNGTIDVNFITVKSNDMIIEYGDEYEFIATFYQGRDSVLANTSILFKVDDDEYPIMTDSNGVARLKIGLGAGTYAITSINTFTGETKVNKLIVNGIATYLTSYDVVTVYNGGKYLVATLNDVLKQPIGGVTVTIELSNGKVYSNLKTDSKGQVKISTNGLTPVKTYVATITFAGNAKFVNSTSSVKITVKKATPKLTVKKKTFKRSVKVKKYSVVLKDNRGKAIKNAKVAIKVGKKTFNAKTNYKGKATFKIKNLKKKGTFKAKIKFAGNTYYNAVTKTVKIKIK